MRNHLTGITSYHWATKASEATLLVPTPGGELLLQTGLDGSPRQLFEGAALDPQISKDGSTVGFVQQGEVHIVSADGGPPRQVTAGAEEGLTNGLADFLAQEELNRYSGFWLSEDGRWLVFEQVDTRHIPEYRIMHQGSDKVGVDAQENHPYVFAGAANPKVRLGCRRVDEESDVVWLDNFLEMDGTQGYLARVHWLSASVPSHAPLLVIVFSACAAVWIGRGLLFLFTLASPGVCARD